MSVVRGYGRVAVVIVVSWWRAKRIGMKTHLLASIASFSWRRRVFSRSAALFREHETA